ncbi:MAG: tRNA (N6-isopentenyl adenosine(37)-C2)-methylthiotransferase MiaB [Patescibacteria group bacterium]|jgi:tRNA-2-methylthio-N6-dimethylallyladenosine synthase
MKYQIITFGCQFNQSDAEKVATVLEKLGLQKALGESEADLIMVLACSVRQSAIDRIYGLKQKFEKIKKNKPLITVLSGCVLKSDLPNMKEIFDIIFNIKDLAELPKMLKVQSSKLKALGYFSVQPSYNSAFQASVPILTGCNNFCTYCVVPYVRGREVSRKMTEVIKECKDLVSNGYKEIILLGQNVNSYKDGKVDFSKLLKKVDEIPGEYWLSFATSHSKDMSDKLIKVMADGKHILPYLHLPVQAGDNEILKKMNRRYTVAHYKSLIKKVRKAVSGIAISTDVIVGFPGETKAQFNNSVKLFQEIKFDMAYISQYSPRAGTVAAKLKDNVPKEEKKRRDKVLTKVLAKTALENNKKLVGNLTEVLVDSYKNGFCFGRTKGFKNIKFASDIDWTGQIVLVQVKDCYQWGLSGELPKVVVVLGTTSAGKTKLAVKLAKKFNGEIISADSRQVYQGMDIGTGKDLAEYGKVPYHLIDVADPKAQFTVARWQKSAYEAINDILKRGKLPIVCGGTGLYISALVEGYNLSETRDQRPEIRDRLDNLSLKQLLIKLKKVDSKTFGVIDKKNRRRVQRALEIYYQSGIPKSEQPKNQKPPYEFLQLGMTFPKPFLHQRIDQRLKHRLEKEGMIAEIKRLHRQGVSWQRLDDFGLEYRFVSRYLKKEINQEEMFSSLSRAIKDFAKRQMTWFRRDKKILWLKNYKQAEILVKKFIR